MTPCVKSPTTDPWRSTSISLTGIWSRKTSPAFVMDIPVCLIWTKFHSLNLSRMRRMLPSPTPASSASFFLPIRFPSERTYNA